MANPIQDWLNKSKKTTESKSTTPPKSKVKASSGLGTGPTPGAGAVGPSSDAAVKAGQDFIKQRQQSRQRQEEALKKKTHQQLINAAYKVAEDLKLKGGPWPLLRSAGWGHLTDNRGALYTGPFIDDLEKLTPEVKEALKKALEL